VSEDLIHRMLDDMVELDLIAAPAGGIRAAL
jgi:hypothetical protein